jgi:hypothetical protein
MPSEQIDILKKLSTDYEFSHSEPIYSKETQQLVDNLNKQLEGLNQNYKKEFERLSNSAVAINSDKLKASYLNYKRQTDFIYTHLANIEMTTLRKYFYKRKD